MDRKYFETQYVCHPFVDKEYEEYLKVWVTYHMRCELFDRSMTLDGRPRSWRDQGLMAKNARLVRSETIDMVRVIDEEKWQRAKMEAVRLVENEFRGNASDGR